MSFFQPDPPLRPLVEWVTVETARHRDPLPADCNGSKPLQSEPDVVIYPSPLSLFEGFVFCSLHRLPEQHGCLFDHLGHGRQEAVQKVVKLRRKVGRSCQRIGEEFF